MPEHGFCLPDADRFLDDLLSFGDLIQPFTTYVADRIWFDDLGVEIPDRSLEMALTH